MMPMVEDVMRVRRKKGYEVRGEGGENFLPKSGFISDRARPMKKGARIAKHLHPLAHRPL
jgi:hypothetical protein